jgi:hypothetical protein
MQDVPGIVFFLLDSMPCNSKFGTQQTRTPRYIYELSYAVAHHFDRVGEPSQIPKVEQKRVGHRHRHPQFWRFTRLLLSMMSDV